MNHPFVADYLAACAARQTMRRRMVAALVYALTSLTAFVALVAV